MRQQRTSKLLMLWLVLLLGLGLVGNFVPQAQAVSSTPFTPSAVKVLVVSRANLHGGGYFISDLARYGYNITWFSSDSAGTSVNFLTEPKTANLQQYNVVVLHQTFTTSVTLNPVAGMSVTEVAHFTKGYSGILIVTANSMFRNETSGGWYGFASQPFLNMEARLGVDFTDFQGGTGTVYNGTYYRLTTVIPNLPSSIPFYFPSGSSFYMPAFSVVSATQLYNFTATASGTGITYYKNATGAIGIYIRTPWVYDTVPSSNLFRYWGLFGTSNARSTSTEIQDRGAFLSRLVAYALDKDYNTIIKFQPYGTFRTDDIGQPDYQLADSYIQPVLSNMHGVYQTTGVTPSHAFIAWHATDPDAWQTTGVNTLALLKTTYSYMDYTSHIRHLRVDQAPYNTWTQTQWETEIDFLNANTTNIGMPLPSGIIAYYDYTTGALNLFKALAAKGYYYWTATVKDSDWWNLRVNQTVILNQPQQFGAGGNIENYTQINADATLAKRALENEFVGKRGSLALSIVNSWFEPFYHLPNWRRNEVGTYSFVNVVYANISAEYPDFGWVAIREAALFYGHRWATISSPTRSGSTITFTVNVDNVPTVATIGKGSLWYRVTTNTSSTIASVKINGVNWYAFDDYTIRIPAANSNIEITLGTPTTPYIKEFDRKVTATSYDGSKLTFTVDSLSGTTSITKVYVGDKGEPTSVSGATSWSYDSATKVVTITKLHSSPADIVVDWTTVFPSQGSPSLNTIYVALGLASLAFLVSVAIGILALVSGGMSSMDMVTVVMAGFSFSVGLFIILIVTNAIGSL